jgi:hypothetical protein
MTDNFAVLVEQEQTRLRAEQAGCNGRAAAVAGAEFSSLGDDRYRLSLPAIGATFEVDRLRREHSELVGELSVRCDLPGARTFDGSLSIADFNFSSARARSERARLLAQRANTRDLDWLVLVEEFCQRVLQADRAGQPAVDLRTLPAPAEEAVVQVEGLALLRRHPMVLFGDGGAAKSYLALYLAGRLAEKGVSVALFDWELCGDDHRDRLERLFPDGMPRLLYARCERPLVYEVDRLRRIVRENGIEFAVYDSVAFACDGPPEAAEVAGRYFRAVRQIGGGSLHVAHITKGENADQRPFGSTFWHNGARATWYVHRASESAEGDVIEIGLFNRKSNLGRLRPALGFKVTFSESRTSFKRMDVADGGPDLAGKLTVRERVTSLLRRGALTVMTIASELDLDVNTVTQTLNRELKKGRSFIVLDGENTTRRVGLLERDRLS